MAAAIDGVVVILILGIAYALASEGAWGAALMFFNVLFAGLIAFNFYEPLTVQFHAWGLAFAWSDFLALMGIFLITVIALRVLTDILAPGMVRLPKPLFHLGRLVFGLGTAAMSVGILLCILYTAPVDRKLFGVVEWDTQPPFKQGLDRAWLSFVQYTTGYAFATYDEDRADDPLFGQANAFDPKASWIIDHQNARPYPEGGTAGKVPAPEAEGG